MKKNLLLFFLLLMFMIGLTGCEKEEINETFDIVYDVTYVSENENACLTFYKNGEYFLYDCDSEPTDYFFDSESDCTYTYKNGYMKFKCKYKDPQHKDQKIRVLNWTDEEFKFKYDDEIIIFKKEN